MVLKKNTFDYNVGLDVKNYNFYYSMGHIWSQYQYKIQIYILIFILEIKFWSLINQYMKATCTL